MGHSVRNNTNKTDRYRFVSAVGIGLIKVLQHLSSLPEYCECCGDASVYSTLADLIGQSGGINSKSCMGM